MATEANDIAVTDPATESTTDSIIDLPPLNKDHYSDKQIKFVHAYAECGVISQAARLAGYTGNRVRDTGWKLLKKPDIARHVELVRRDQAWDFDSWCKRVKYVCHDNNAWQAQLRSLELYGKAKGWLRDSSDVHVNVLSLVVDEIRRSNRGLAMIADINSRVEPINSSNSNHSSNSINSSNRVSLPVSNSCINSNSIPVTDTIVNNLTINSEPQIRPDPPPPGGVN